MQLTRSLVRARRIYGARARLVFSSRRWTWAGHLGPTVRLADGLVWPAGGVENRNVDTSDAGKPAGAMGKITVAEPGVMPGDGTQPEHTALGPLGGAQPSAVAIFARCRAPVSFRKAPCSVGFPSEMQLNTTNKIDKAAPRQPFRDRPSPNVG
jgi:acyl-CoA synthetase (AMP-forming)/AMP-acid ligase II